MMTAQKLLLKKQKPRDQLKIYLSKKRLLLWAASQIEDGSEWPPGVVICVYM
jgi:hypothetical protein